MQVFRCPELGHLPPFVSVDEAAGIIAIHPAFDHEQAVAEIRFVLPDALPDVVEHWVESVLPTVPPLSMTVPIPAGALMVSGEDVAGPHRPTTPLSSGGGHAGEAEAVHAPAPSRPRPQSGSRKRKRHARPGAPARAARRTVSALGATGVGALAAMMTLQPGMANAEAWDNPLFLEIASMATLDCHPLRDQPLRAQCVTAAGVSVEAEAMVGADSLTYTFFGLGASRAVVKVFATERALARWLNSINNADRFPNLVTGDRVAVYGSDPDAIAPFLPAAEGLALTAEEVAPIVLRASYALGLVPSDLAMAMFEVDETLGEPTASGTPEAVQAQAMAIMTGDPRLRSQVEVSTDDPWTADPVVPESPPRVVPVRQAPRDTSAREPSQNKGPEPSPSPDPPPDEAARPAPKPEPGPEPVTVELTVEPVPAKVEVEVEPVKVPKPLPEVEVPVQVPVEVPVPEVPVPEVQLPVDVPEVTCDGLLEELLADLPRHPTRDDVLPIYDRLADELCPLIEPRQVWRAVREQWHTVPDVSEAEQLLPVSQ